MLQGDHYSSRFSLQILVDLYVSVYPPTCLPSPQSKLGADIGTSTTQGPGTEHTLNKCLYPSGEMEERRDLREEEGGLRQDWWMEAGGRWAQT